MKLKLFSVLCAGLVLFGGIRLYHSLTDDFRIANIKEDLPYRPEWETTSLTRAEKKQLRKILSQRFTYLSKGAQSYVFASDDGKYVIKFFKFKHARPHMIVRMLPSLPYLEDYKKRHLGKKRRKLIGPFRGYHLANETLKKESGLIAVHLNKTHTLRKLLKVKDKIGFVRSIPLDDVVFVIQERAEPTTEVLTRLLDDADVDTARTRISQLKELLRNEYRHQVADYDKDTLKNTGFIGNRAIRIDLGMLYRDPGMKDPQFHLKRIDREIEQWVHKHYPQHAQDVLR